VTHLYFLWQRVMNHICYRTDHSVSFSSIVAPFLGTVDWYSSTSVTSFPVQLLWRDSQTFVMAVYGQHSGSEWS
jgi:hypothetical protein